MMFEDPKYLLSLKGYLDKVLKETSESNEFHKHLSWVLAKSTLRTPKIECSFCRKETAQNTLFVRDNFGKYFSKKELVSCSSLGCISALSDAGTLNYIFKKKQIIPLRFPVFAQLPLDLGSISKFLQEVFDISELTPKTAFEFFNK